MFSVTLLSACQAIRGHIPADCNFNIVGRLLCIETITIKNVANYQGGIDNKIEGAFKSCRVVRRYSSTQARTQGFSLDWEDADREPAYDLCLTLNTTLRNSCHNYNCNIT